MASETQYKTIIHEEQCLYAQSLADRKAHAVPKKKSHSAFHCKLRDETGDKRIAYSIWKIGMPEPSQWCGEITSSDELTEAISNGLAADAKMILKWLCMIADIVQSMKSEARKSSHC